MKDILNKALVANADTDAVAKVIDTVVNTPRQDAQPKTDKEVAIKRSLAVEEALAKRYEALRKAAIDIIADAVRGKIDCIKAADDIIKLVTAGRIIDVDIDVAKGKDKSDKWVFRKDANGRIFELRGVNNDAPDELY
jgi:hypothetical protein